MATFTDAAGREWALDVRPGWLDAVRAKFGVDLAGRDWATQLAAWWRSAPVDALTACYGLVIRQADERGLGAVEAVEVLGLAGEPFLRALWAGLERATGFPPGPGALELPAGGQG